MAGKVPVRPYRRPQPTGWWLRHPRYFAYMMREIGGILIGFYGLLYLWQLSQLPAGANAYDAFVETLYSPLFVAFGAVVFVFSLVHTLSWFSLVPKALPPKVERMGIPAVAIVGGFVVLWLIVSWLVAVIVFGL